MLDLFTRDLVLIVLMIYLLNSCCTLVNTVSSLGGLSTKLFGRLSGTLCFATRRLVGAHNLSTRLSLC